MNHETSHYNCTKTYIDEESTSMSTMSISNLKNFRINSDTSSINYDKSISIKNIKSFDDHFPESNVYVSQICKQSYTISRAYGKASLFLSCDKVLNGNWILTDRIVIVYIDTDIRNNKTYLKLVENKNKIVFYRKEISDNTVFSDKRYNSFFFFFDDDHCVGLYFKKMNDSYLFKHEIDKRRHITNKYEENEVEMKEFPHTAFIQATTNDYPMEYTNVSFRVNNIPHSWKSKFKSLEFIKSIDTSGNIVMCSVIIIPKDSHNLKDEQHKDTIRFNKAKEKLFQFTHNLVKDRPISQPLKIKRDSTKKQTFNEVNPRDELMDQIKGYTLNYLKKTSESDQVKVEEEVQHDSNNIHDRFYMAMKGRRKDISDDEEEDDDW